MNSNRWNHKWKWEGSGGFVSSFVDVAGHRHSCADVHFSTPFGGRGGAFGCGQKAQEAGARQKTSRSEILPILHAATLSSWHFIFSRLGIPGYGHHAPLPGFLKQKRKSCLAQ